MDTNSVIYQLGDLGQVTFFCFQFPWLQTKDDDNIWVAVSYMWKAIITAPSSGLALYKGWLK